MWCAGARKGEKQRLGCPPVPAKHCNSPNRDERTCARKKAACLASPIPSFISLADGAAAGLLDTPTHPLCKGGCVAIKGIVLDDLSLLSTRLAARRLARSAAPQRRGRLQTSLQASRQRMPCGVLRRSQILLQLGHVQLELPVQVAGRWQVLLDRLWDRNSGVAQSRFLGS